MSVRDITNTDVFVFPPPILKRRFGAKLKQRVKNRLLKEETKSSQRFLEQADVGRGLVLQAKALAEQRW